MDDFLTFSGHSDTKLAIWLKKLEIWHNLSQGGEGSLFEHGQLFMILFWLTLNMDPPLHCLIFCQISDFLTEKGCSMSKWPEKTNKFDLVAFTGLQNFQNKVRYAWRYQRKGPFLTSVLIIIKSNEVNKWIFDFFLPCGHWNTHFSQKCEIWLNLSNGGGVPKQCN